MRTLTITLGLLFALAVTAVYGAVDNKDVRVSEKRKVENFSSIDITAVATIYFEQSDRCSFKIEGKEKGVKKTKSYVKNGVLTIEREKDSNGNLTVQNGKKDGVVIYLTAPDLKEVEFAGVGSFNSKSSLKLGDVKFEIEGVGKVNIVDLKCRTLKVEIEGVGKANIHVNCDYLKADVEGIGSMELSGSAGRADISKGGIGRVNTRHLFIGK
ncbi:MAG: DUF2807 domain-containing protein [Bacteroides sp.]|jgi:hypothetical protein|nr:DUF2807 domain-containing protein [Bacteroides sp.]MCI1681988.1 DUF2807 domain-containing protein [Bacteroides sp.]